MASGPATPTGSWFLLLLLAGTAATWLARRDDAGPQQAVASSPASPQGHDELTVSGIVHNTALRSIEQTLDVPGLPEAAADGLRAAAFTLRAFLDNPGARTSHRDGDGLMQALTTALVPLHGSGFTVDLVCDVGPLHPDVVAATRVAVEAAVQNARRHAQVDRVAVAARQRQDGSLVVAVRDDGVGIVPGRQEGYGLREAIHGTVQRAGGTSRVRTVPDIAGTLVQMVFPPVGGRAT